MLRILHLAPMNYAGVPYDFYRMHHACGDFSRLITYHKNERNFPEDVCLELPLATFNLAKLWRKKKLQLREEKVITAAPYFEPKNIFEHAFFSLNDFLKQSKVDEVIEKYDLNNFDVIHYDAGLDFFRDSRQAKKFKKLGKKIVCCYYGSDLRLRGIIKDLDAISDLNITSEFDHLSLKKDLNYLFYPYDPSELPERSNIPNEKVTIIHSPTNRQYKGTELIISVIEKIKKEKDIEFHLMENVDRTKLLKIKASADISIDQVGGTMGGTGYGKAGIETLALGLPTITNMTKDYKDWLPENPFVVANNAEELYKLLNELIDSKALRVELGMKGKAWVNKYHGYRAVDEQLKKLYKQTGII